MQNNAVTTYKLYDSLILGWNIGKTMLIEIRKLVTSDGMRKWNEEWNNLRQKCSMPWF